MRRSRRTIISAALLPTLSLTLGVVSAGFTTALVTAAPAAAADRTWSAPAALTGERNTSAGVVVTPDGTAVTVWTKGTFGDATQELWGATRAAGATAWSAPVRIAADQTMVTGVRLVSGEDGSATVVWNRHDDENFDSHQTSTLKPGAAAWTAPARITAAPFAHDLMLVNGPGGRLTAVWNGDPTPGENDADAGVYAADLPATGGTWSDAVLIGAGYAYEFKASAGADGTVTVAWQADTSGAEQLRVSTRAAGSAQWSAPATVGTGDRSLGELDVQTAANGATLITWWHYNLGRDFVYRPAGSATWGPRQYLPAETDRGSTSIPQLEADGRVTAVWYGAGGLRTATRAVDGSWSQTRTVAENTDAHRIWAPSIGRDGSLAVLWTTLQGELWALTRSDGAWGKPAKAGAIDLSTEGSVAAGADGRAVGVWDKQLGTTSDHHAINQVWSTSTGGVKPGPPAKRRDYVGADGFPDVYARGADGSLLVYRGNAAGTVSAKADGGLWPTTSTVVPFGDLSGDGANDTLVTDASGTMHRYAPERGKPVTPGTASVKLGTGWTAFDGLTYSGDFTADGLPDLVARQTATGDLYLFAGTKSGGLARTGKIGTSWKSLTIVGAGDLNGDRHADLVARTATGDLYRYYGTGKGTIGSGTKIGSGWGGMADFVGIGDLTGDGKDDILGRTKTGDLYRYAGNGTGGIGSGVKIGTGWKSFTSVS
ncbi:FG-GAP repeat domain-containing protein [Streptomyces sp. NPDC048604]|uniref:FG-GAP repeat domain-containing protein n=1 Tax=Streptomyces sp. NPDC048604 TaxID=3365578 RepID=UPI00371B1833